jgi:hypothetical protein
MLKSCAGYVDVNALLSVVYQIMRYNFLDGHTVWGSLEKISGPMLVAGIGSLMRPGWIGTTAWSPAEQVVVSVIEDMLGDARKR